MNVDTDSLKRSTLTQPDAIGHAGELSWDYDYCGDSKF